MSLHLKEDGFFPGSGGSEVVGLGRGRFFNLNVPLKEGVRDDDYFALFSALLDGVLEAFRPLAIVVQGGNSVDRLGLVKVEAKMVFQVPFRANSAKSDFCQFSV